MTGVEEIVKIDEARSFSFFDGMVVQLHALMV